MTTQPENQSRTSWYESTARERLEALLDDGSLTEYVGPEKREVSPHLALFDLPEAFDDGVVVGRGEILGRRVFFAAQEGRFMGGAFGEVHAAKLVGLLRFVRSHPNESRTVLLLLDTGGVRLQEANAGEVGVSEIIRAILEARHDGVTVIAMIGGRAGCFGGGAIITGCCSRIIVSEQGRIGVTGPEVIETNVGAEEFDSHDRPLVWRITGGKSRRLIGGADIYVEDSVEAFRKAAIEIWDRGPELELAILEAEQARLARRLNRFGRSHHPEEIWQEMGIPKEKPLADLSDQEFTELVANQEEANHEAR